jgi:hypothetical protein
VLACCYERGDAIKPAVVFRIWFSGCDHRVLASNVFP